ncbi:MAG TPA: FAD-linked oxidase C-terminal domain-containing protein [Rhodospirillales bacterium]|jgi:D-lactate dehydrogenase (cytochrome)|nr:FAD-linked oxidase C-terminal domain-containing protein [Rhodospirillales bacterium]
MAEAEAAKRVNDDLLDALRGIVGDRLSTTDAVLGQHGRDETYHTPHPPDVVVFPETTEEVSRIVGLCAEREVPVIPFGTGTSLEGHVAALEGGVCIDLTRMNEVIRVNADDMDVTVQAGVTRKQLNEHLRDTGLFFPVDPGADASLGGMTATRASGTTTVRYGSMRENVLALAVVLADGRVINTSRRARKSAAGYDLTRLFVGSEGTLGVITEVTLRLFGIPEAISAALCPFPDLASAVNTSIRTIQMGVPVARIELMDEVLMEAINKNSNLEYSLQPTLLFEFHGSALGVVEHAETVQAIAAEFGAEEFQWETKAEDRNRLWQARHDAYYACLALRPGAKGFSTDVCVPISRLVECVTETRRDIDETGLVAPIVGHVGDGNFHVVVVMDFDDLGEVARAKAFNERLVTRALAMDGTCTGEHGIGHGKIEFLTAEHGEAVSVMRALKMAIDPQNIMNPGKIVRV